MAINYCCAYDRMKRRQRGERVPDPEQQYKVLKAMEQTIEKRYAEGKIKQEKYESYKKSLQRWEEMMQDG